MSTESLIDQQRATAERILRLFERPDALAEPDAIIEDDFEQYLHALKTDVLTGVMPVSSPRFIGHMTSALPGFFDRLAPIVTSLNQNLVKRETSGALTDLEREVLNRLSRLIFSSDGNCSNSTGYDRRTSCGILTTGGTLANITALWCARNQLLKRARLDDQDGRMVIIGSELMHYSFDKGVDLLGMGTESLIRIPVDAEHRVRIDSLQDAVDQCHRNGDRIVSIIGIAGTTDSGATDDLDALARIATDAGCHFHVDAAWGGPVLFSKLHRSLLAGIERADSVTIDGHKQLYTPLGIGMLLFRDPELASVIEKTAPYAVRESADDLGRRSLEGSRPAMVLYLDAALQTIGDDGYGWLIDESVRKAKYLSEQVDQNQNFELLIKPQTNIVLYRQLPPAYANRHQAIQPDDNRVINEWNVKLQRLQRTRGKTFVSRTTVDHTPAYADQEIVTLRAILANPLTTEADIDAVLQDQLLLSHEL